MLSFRKQFFLCLGILSIVFTFSSFASAQRLSFNHQYQLEPLIADAPPEFINTLNIEHPEDAWKNGVEGTLRASFVIAADGSTKDIVIEKSLPHGVDEAVKIGIQNLRFKPATRDGEPVEAKMSINYVISAVYEHRNKKVQKPKFIEKPEPIYPAEHLSEKRKGRVEVRAIFYADGKIEIVGVSSTMPKAFDTAAVEAAKKIKFEPAIHKKSKKPVTQQMFLEYKFKP